MEESYLSSVIGMLTVDERAECVLFLESPYFNRGNQARAIIDLFGILVNDGKEKWTKEAIFEKVFPNTPWVHGKLDKLMSELSRLLRLFLLTRNYLKEDHQFDHWLTWAKILRKRAVSNRYDWAIGRAEKALENNELESLDMYYDKLRLEYEKHDRESYLNLSKGDLNIPAVLTHLDVFYHTYRLQVLNRLLVQHKIARTMQERSFDGNQRLPFSPELLEKFGYLNVQYHIAQIMDNDNPEPALFHDFMALLEGKERFIEPELLKEVYTYLRNICTILINNGNESFYAVLHQIQKDNLKRGYFFYEGKLQPHLYMNVARVAIRLGNIAWAGQFIETYKNIVSGDNNEQDFYRLLQAEWLFAQQLYDAAYEILPQSFSDITYHLSCRRLEIKIFYETSSDLLPYKVDAYKMYISRASQKVVSDQRREQQANFVNLLQQLMQTSKGDTVRVERVRKRIQGKKMLAEREWLMEKVEQLS